MKCPECKADKAKLEAQRAIGIEMAKLLRRTRNPILSQAEGNVYVEQARILGLELLDSLKRKKQQP